MYKRLRSATTTEGRRMAGARSLWRANGMKEEHFGRPVIAIVNSFTQFVPGHAHLHEVGQYIKSIIEAEGCFAAEFNTIAVDDESPWARRNVVSLPSRDVIADSVEYMCNAIRPMRWFAFRIAIKLPPNDDGRHAPEYSSYFCFRRTMEAGEIDGKKYDLSMPW